MDDLVIAQIWSRYSDGQQILSFPKGWKASDGVSQGDERGLLRSKGSLQQM
jgi:hypothetical protein